MIGYITLGTNNLKRAEEFYNELFAAMDIKQIFKTDKTIAWGKNLNSPLLTITLPYDEKPATVGNGCMVALRVENPEAVIKLYKKARELGAKCEGEPGPRGKSFYGAYFRDLDGNKLNVHCNS